MFLHFASCSKAKAGKNLINLFNDHIFTELLYRSTFAIIFSFPDYIGLYNLIYFCAVNFFSAQNLLFDKTHWNKKSQMRAIPLLVTWLLYLHSKSGKICVKWKPRNGTKSSFQIALLFCGSKTKIPVHQL